MTDKIDLKKVLQAFQTIVNNGKKVGSEYVLNGLIASSDVDGYTITIRNEYVILNILFHNKFTVDFPNLKEKTLFFEKIYALSKAPSYDFH